MKFMRANNPHFLHFRFDIKTAMTLSKTAVYEFFAHTVIFLCVNEFTWAESVAFF